MKTGTITFHCTDNPGSLLQTYALHKTLNDLGCENEVINYQKKGWKNEFAAKYYLYLSKFGVLKYPLGLAWRIYIGLKRYCFLYFQRKNIVLSSRKICKKEDLKILEKKYDVVISGSDQIWNVYNEKVDYSFFLDFVSDDRKKVAYAASFGMDSVPEKNKQEIINLLNAYSAISVREQEAMHLVSELIGKNVQQVLDPTLLLNQEQWNDLAKKSKYKNYIFLYVRRREKKIADYCSRLSEQTGLRIVEVTGTRKLVRSAKNVKLWSPVQWLGLIRDSNYVVTNSFHGIVFSIIFKKEFYAFPLEGSQDSGNSRMYSLLRMFGLEDRLIEAPDVDYKKECIDYEKVEEIIKKEQKKSMKFIYENIKKVEDEDRLSAK